MQHKSIISLHIIYYESVLLIIQFLKRNNNQRCVMECLLSRWNRLALRALICSSPSMMYCVSFPTVQTWCAIGWNTIIKTKWFGFGVNINKHRSPRTQFVISLIITFTFLSWHREWGFEIVRRRRICVYVLICWLYSVYIYCVCVCNINQPNHLKMDQHNMYRIIIRC